MRATHHLPSLPTITALPTVTSPLPLQTTTGGSPTVVLLVFAALFVATLLSMYLALRLYRGYRTGGGRGTLLLGVGLVLVTTVPLLVRLALSNVPAVPPTTRSIVATASQLVGLLVVLGVIHDRR
ncbi:hypothetical protein [Halorarum halobium]|uniref:hypothetical protein n=1 Tax=Halorarum halobium TaxID=3075121 RepID=UPI0028A59542|nr:hypothetical protein [Halobaculum sp. XH14]